MKAKKSTGFLLALFTLVPNLIWAQALGYNNNRIAISCDGNSAPDTGNKFPTADPDDWCASPMELALIAKLQLQNRLTHFSYNNFMASPIETDAQNQMKKGIDAAVTNWKYDATRIFDVPKTKAAAIAHLKNELAKSAASDPLYFIHAGPCEFFYQCVNACVAEGHVAALAYVHVISHSSYNDNELRRPDHHTMTQTISKSNNLLNYKKIADQNTGLKTAYDKYFWLRDHKDTSLRFIFDRMKAHPANVVDPSDAGMVYYLLKNDENGTPEKLRIFMGNGIPLTSVKSAGREYAPAAMTMKYSGHSLTLAFNSDKTLTGDCAIIGLNGKIQFHRTFITSIGANTRVFNFGSIPTGLYTVQIKTGLATVFRKLCIPF